MTFAPTNAYLDEDETGDGPWYCLIANPFYCPDCKRVQHFLHIKIPRQEVVAIVVFDEKDDDSLLEMAITWKERNKNPRIIEFQPDFGLCMPVDDILILLGANNE